MKKYIKPEIAMSQTSMIKNYMITGTDNGENLGGNGGNASDNGVSEGDARRRAEDFDEDDEVIMQMMNDEQKEYGNLW